MQIKSGVVKFPAGKEFPDKFNPGQTKQNLKIQMDDGTDETIWFRTGRQPHAGLQRGQTVQVLFSERLGKMTRRLLVNDKPANQQPEPQPQYQGLTPDTKRAIANYIQDQAKLMRYCLETARENFSDQIETEESLRTLATTLFIATQRHFGL